jgi:hypothetical protein
MAQACGLILSSFSSVKLANIIMHLLVGGDERMFFVATENNIEMEYSKPYKSTWTI